MTFSLSTVRIDGVPTPVLRLPDGPMYRLADVAPEVLDDHPAAGLMGVFTNWETSEPRLLAAVETLAGSAAGQVPEPAGPEDWLTPL